MLVLLKEVLLKAKKALTTLSGLLIHFTLEQPKKAKKLVLKYSPAQDLNGYTEPWTAGNGKNRFSFNAGVLYRGASGSWSYETTDNSITMTATGTGGAQYARLSLNEVFDAAKTYRYTCKANKILKGTDGSPCLQVIYYGSNDNSNFTNIGMSQITPSNTVQGREESFSKSLTGYAYYRIAFYNNANSPVTIGEKTSYYDIMLEEGATATDYEPYENIGTLTVYNNDYVTISKKNMLYSTLEQMKTLNINGTWSGNVYSYRGVDYTVETNDKGFVTKIHSEGTSTGGSSNIVPGYYNFRNGIPVILNGCPAGGSGSTYRLFVSDTGVAGYDMGTGRTITPTADVRAMVRIQIINGYTTNQDWYPMIRRGDDTEATFEPFDGEQIYSNFGGFYGGQYDVVTGKRLVEYKSDDFGDMTWSYSTTAVSGIGVFLSNNIMDKLAGSNDFICSGYELAGTSRTFLKDVKSGITPYNSTTSKAFAVRNDYYTDAATFKTAMTGIKVIYRMETPEIQDKAAFDITMATGEKNVGVRRATDMTLVYESEE